MKYRCDDCGAVFEEPLVYSEPSVGYEALWCPECQCDAIMEVEECKLCGELSPVHLLTVDGYCPDCVKKAAHKYDAFLKSCEPEELRIFEEQFGIEPINY